jgi:hypothetical protein
VQSHLHVVTSGNPPADAHTFDGPIPVAEPCDGTYTCDCGSCKHERAERVRQGVRPRRRSRQRVAA